MITRNIRTITSSGKSGESLVVPGWIRTVRDSKNIVFISLNDGSNIKGLQIVVDKDHFNNPDVLQQLSVGCAIVAKGVLQNSIGQGQSLELLCSEIKVEGTSPEDYPLQKKRHTLEYLREIAHLRPRTNTIGAVERVRSRMAYAIHNFFQERGFVYVHTPIITASDCEGAGEMFNVTTLDAEALPRTKDGKVDFERDFFGKKAYLTVSGQLEGETYAMAMGNIYTFGPTFRAENSNTKRHLAEFWMIEPEMAFCDINDNMEVAESFLKYIFKDVIEHCSEDMDFFDSFVEKGVKKTLLHVIETPFVHMTYTDAIKELEKNNDAFNFKVKWGCDIQTEHERFLTEEVAHSPVIVTDYPKAIKSFYMKENEDGQTVRGMDVLVPRLGEIIGGSEREADYTKLLARIKELGLDEKNYSWYLDLRKYGSCTHSGFGLGFERAILYATGMQNIRDVIPYPRYVRSAEF